MELQQHQIWPEFGTATGTEAAHENYNQLVRSCSEQEQVQRHICPELNANNEQARMTMANANAATGIHAAEAHAEHTTNRDSRKLLRLKKDSDSRNLDG